MHEKTFFVGLCCVYFSVWSKPEIDTLIEPISTDRPDQSESSAAVPFKHFQMEFGMNIESTEKELQYVHPTILWRVGILKATELRLTTDVVSQKDTSGKYNVGLAPMSIGFKTNICTAHKARPSIGILSSIVIPYLSTKNVRTRYFAPAFRLAFDHDFKKDISLGYNAGIEWDGFSPQPAFIYTIVNGFGLKKNWSIYYEFYGSIPIHQKSTHNWDAGITYVIKNTMQVDVSGGFQLYPFAKGWFASIGYSFRIPN